jgi:gluconate 2-dehydrogenase gamma chain
MIKDTTLSRRNFLQSGTSLGGAAWLKLSSPGLLAAAASACSAKREAAPFRVLTDSEPGDFAAIAARLIPTTDTPGATEAGVVYFIDHAFADFMSDRLAGARSGLREFNAALEEAFPGAQGLGGLDPSDQDAFLTTREDTGFFQLVRFMTISGFFSMQEYGGNQDQVGWKLIGFQGHQGAWTHPFGYYDAAAGQEQADGE